MDNTTLRNYHYVKSDRYQTPNTNPRIIPVLFCDPVEFSRHPDSTEFVITNFGAFHLEFAPGDGRLYGYFVRELVIGGVPIRNDVADRSLLPVRVQLRQ